MHYQNLGSRLKFSRHTFHILLILSVTKNKILILADTFETRDEIDKDRAINEKEKAELLLKENDSDKICFLPSLEIISNSKLLYAIIYQPLLRHLQ